MTKSFLNSVAGISINDLLYTLVDNTVVEVQINSIALVPATGLYQRYCIEYTVVATGEIKWFYSDTDCIAGKVAMTFSTDKAFFLNRLGERALIQANAHNEPEQLHCRDYMLTEAQNYFQSALAQ